MTPTSNNLEATLSDLRRHATNIREHAIRMGAVQGQGYVGQALGVVQRKIHAGSIGHARRSVKSGAVRNFASPRRAAARSHRVMRRASCAVERRIAVEGRIYR